MANILEEKIKIAQKNTLETNIKNLKINLNSKLIKNIGHTSLKIVILARLAIDVVNIANSNYFYSVPFATNTFCFYIDYRISKGNWKDYFNDKKNLKILKQDLKALKDNINLIDTEAVLISEEDIESYQKYKK